MAKATIRDIAARAGVSPATVSNALNGRKGVGDEMRERIERIAKEMGYEYEAPRAVKRNYIRLVVFKRHGLVVMDTQFFMELMGGIERECHINCLDLMISNIHMEQDGDYLERIKGICKEDCAGILLLATEMHQDDMRLFSATSSPLLIVDSLFPHIPLNTVCINNYDAGYRATEHLIHMGHTRITHVTSSARFQNMAHRRMGYEEAMRAAGLDAHIDYSWRVSPTVEGAYADILARLDTQKELPTALFAANDIIAVGCTRALKERGYKVPGDVSLVGMDDLQLAQLNSPPLTTIRVMKREMGRVAVQRLAQMNSQQAPECALHAQVCIELIERKSVRDLRHN